MVQGCRTCDIQSLYLTGIMTGYGKIGLTLMWFFWSMFFKIYFYMYYITSMLLCLQG